MDKPEHNEENIQRLAATLVGLMDMSDLIELATDKQIEIFEQDKEVFEKDWEYFKRNGWLPKEIENIQKKLKF